MHSLFHLFSLVILSVCPFSFLINSSLLSFTILGFLYMKVQPKNHMVATHDKQIILQESNINQIIMYEAK